MPASPDCHTWNRFLIDSIVVTSTTRRSQSHKVHTCRNPGMRSGLLRLPRVTPAAIEYAASLQAGCVRVTRQTDSAISLPRAGPPIGTHCLGSGDRLLRSSDNTKAY
jgi:hypothetical protein